MSANAPIFVTSRFRSGSTFLWSLFRKDPRYCCYYEPFHDNLTETVELNLPAMESHRGVTSYWDEYRNVAGDLTALHRPQFGISDLLLRPCDKKPELVHFIQHLMRAAAREGRTCVIKCNRLDFRLPWLRANFPDAKIIYIHRNPRDQWISSVRPHKPELWDRLEENIGYDLPAWISSLAPQWPFLLDGPARPAYYYSHLLWTLSREFGERYADCKLDFDRDIADEPANLAENLAPFFSGDFFQQSVVKALIKPTRPGLWRKFRTEEWFQELELQSARTLRQAGIHKPAFWRWPATAKTVGSKPGGELRQAVDLALLMFSRHRADLMVHGHQLQHALDVAQKHAASLSQEYEKSRDALKSTESQRNDLDNKHRLLQAVYDSLKQAHDISINSLTKTLEEFQYATKELRQLIAYKDAQLLQLTDQTAEVQKTLTDTKAQDRVDELTGQLAEARKVEQTLRQELENSRIGMVKLEGATQAELTETRAKLDRLNVELAGTKKAAGEARTLMRHVLTLEISSSETWSTLVATRKDLAARDEFIKALQGEALVLQDSARAQNDEIAAIRCQLAQETAAKAALSGELDEARTALAAAQADLSIHQALKIHRDALERANHEGWQRIVELRDQLAATSGTLERERADQAALLEARAQQIAELGTSARQLEAKVSLLEQELENRLSALDAAQAAGRHVTGELAEARQRIDTLEADAAAAALRLQELQSSLHSAHETREASAQKTAALAHELLAEKSARTSEKAAYDQRTAKHVSLLKEAHQMLSAEKSRWTGLESEQLQQIASLNEQLSAATARMAAIEKSWASGLIQRLAPAAFKPSNSP